SKHAPAASDPSIAGPQPVAAVATTTDSSATTSAPTVDAPAAVDATTTIDSKAAPTAPTNNVDGLAATASATPKSNFDGVATGRGTSEPTGPSGLSDAERTRFVQRVSRAMQSAGESEGTLRLRLSPPELGSVRLEVSVKDGVMSARLETETPAAKA